MSGAEAGDDLRLRDFWNSRYSAFTLSESGWLGAGEQLNDRLYACKRQALRRALGSLGLRDGSVFSVLDAGCGQGHFARVYRQSYPRATYVGVDISERAVAHLRQACEGVEFHVGNLCGWHDPQGRRFDVVQSFEVLHLILDDEAMVSALASMAAALSDRGTMLISTPLPDATLQPSTYLRYRSRSFWEESLAQLGLRIVAERPMFYWLPAGGPSNRYARYALTRLGPGALYALDRAALALRVPRPASYGPDCRTSLLTIRRS
ncbi:MAG TPA: methyltransferase domain-containing protein [Vicinamibacterales bacterium]|nr:methyltransferase domain-containing protein [Vicinamibacterales bacterium]